MAAMVEGRRKWAARQRAEGGRFTAGPERDRQAALIQQRPFSGNGSWPAGGCRFATRREVGVPRHPSLVPVSSPNALPAKRAPRMLPRCGHPAGAGELLNRQRAGRRRQEPRRRLPLGELLPSVLSRSAIATEYFRVGLGHCAGQFGAA